MGQIWGIGWRGYGEAILQSADLLFQPVQPIQDLVYLEGRDWEKGMHRPHMPTPTAPTVPPRLRPPPRNGPLD